MKIYYLLNDNKEIIEDGFTKFNDNCLEMERENYHIRNGYNGMLFFEDYMETDEYKEKARVYSEYQTVQALRKRREQECFSIINRGQLWYSKLTAAQIEELNAWYAEWLDVTETLVVPTPPEWLANY